MGCGQKVSSKKLTLDAKKTYRLMKEEIDGLTRAHKRLAYDYMGDMMKLVSRAKINGYIPEGGYGTCQATHYRQKTFGPELVTTEEDFPDSVRDIVDSVLTRAITESYNGTIDFDDQIYMSALFGGSFPQYPVVMVDEAQDLSPLNHEMLSRLRAGRLIAVGDPWQSIYGFRGSRNLTVCSISFGPLTNDRS